MTSFKEQCSHSIYIRLADAIIKLSYNDIFINVVRKHIGSAECSSYNIILLIWSIDFCLKFNESRTMAFTELIIYFNY